MTFDSTKNIRLVLNDENGYSLMELMAVVAIISFTAGIGFVTLMSMKNRLVLDDAAADMVFALEQAQNRSATGFGTSGHGVRIESDRIIFFDGDSYVEGVGEEKKFPSIITTDKTDTNIIFKRISGSIVGATDVTVVISNIANGANKTIKITKDGRIISQ